MSGVQTFRASSVEAITRAKLAALGPTGAPLTVSVCIPCKNEAETIGELVTTIRASLMGDGGLAGGLMLCVLPPRVPTSGSSAQQTCRAPRHSRPFGNAPRWVSGFNF